MEVSPGNVAFLCSYFATWPAAARCPKTLGTMKTNYFSTASGTILTKGTV
jgi:hypothetical protein